MPEEETNLNSKEMPANGNKTTRQAIVKCVDGNWAAAHVSYRTNDCAFIFPITPSSPMGEEVDAWAAEHKKNLWNQELKVIEMQSEAGAAGALHGSLQAGTLATTYTASQGLLLFIPNMYKIAGELLPTVIHVASRALAGEALSIYGDHSDTMLVRGCGWAMMSSFSVQEAHDMAVICQVATLNSRVPFLHFFDGFRTSHEINKICLVSDEELCDLLPFDKIEEHRQRGLSPLHPTQRGTAQAPDVFMQMVESSNQNYNQVKGHIEKAMADFERVVGRKYEPFEFRYYGTSHPKVAIVCMGSGVTVINATLRYLKNESTCVIGVRMFRPWDWKGFCESLPKSVTRLAVLDRTREGGSQGEPLYLDVCTSLMQGHRKDIFVAGGRYGLGSKDFTPRMVSAIINNMLRKNETDIKSPFTVGINDDVTNLSLPLGRPLSILDANVTQCVFWGFGSDGTVGANKEAVKLIGNYHDDMSVQAYFEYDAKKSSGWTISHLRFSPSVKIEAPFRVEDGMADYVACHNESYVQANKFDVVKFCKRRGNFFLNTTAASIKDPVKRIEVLEKLISPKILKTLSMKNINFYIMDAGELSRQYGLAGRINMICQTVFFRLSNVVPLMDAVALLKAAIKKAYGHKGDEIVKKNIDLLDAVVSDPNTLIKVEVPSSWKKVQPDAEFKAFEERHGRLLDDEKVRKFMTDIVDPVTRLEGDEIPVSKFLENHLLGGVMVPGTTKFEKRNPNPSKRIPKWNFDSCTQCNQCIFVCPHAAIRPFIITKEEAQNAPFPVHFETIKATGSEFGGKKYAIQVSPLDCTGCNACVEACPEEPKALEMQSIEIHQKENEENWNYAYDLPERGDLIDKSTVRGSQFQTPLMEFSGACSGCGETPYFKLLTQLFGERMVIANATGCSSIWGGSFPSNPYTVSRKTGRGPAWANSLFEDNAEYGFGMFIAMRQRRERLIHLVQDYVHIMEMKLPSDKSLAETTLVHLLLDWQEACNEKSDKCTLIFDKMKTLFEELVEEVPPGNKAPLLNQIWSERDMFPKLSQWIVGGDGWAYDIGFGGLDHIEAFESNDVNVLVVDTEMYSNTGGQMSKATPVGSSVKFATSGKTQRKKNIGEMFMTYEHVYVASVCLANQSQVLQAFLEADRHDGPSFVVAYAPCVQHGLRAHGLDDMVEECRLAVDTGYWPLYRYNPELLNHGKNPFILDSKKLRKDVQKFLSRETRFMKLQKACPKIAEDLFTQMNRDVSHRMEHLNQMAAGYKAFDHADDASVKVLFASETGTAAQLARDFADACILSHGAEAMDDVEVDDLDGMTTVFFIATCGQGKMPQNGTLFFKALCARTEPFKEGTKFAVMGLGDSSYFFFCEAAKQVEQKMVELGATKLLNIGYGDDSAEEGLEEGLHSWLDQVWPVLEVPPPAEVPHILPARVEYSPKAVLLEAEEERIVRMYYESDGIKAKSIPIRSNSKMCEATYNRDFRTIRLETGGALAYELGDALEIFPHNDKDKVSSFLHAYSPDFDDGTVIKIHDFGIDGEVTIGTLFTYVLDLFGKPSKHFMQQLATFEKDEDEKKMILDVGFLKKAAKETGMTIADALLRFNNAHPPLPALLAMIPPIKPRAYSIASAPLASPGVIELLVLIDTWWCDSGEKVGLTCDMLRQKVAGDHLWCRIKAGSMDPPEPQQPVLCAGIGSGLAPHMAFLRDKVRAAEAGEVVGPFSLYFGNRKKAFEFLYQSELEDYEKKYDWFKLHTAFSRDDPSKKVYVQDLVGQTDDARVLLRETNDGMMYVCGNRNLPKPLQDALVRSFSKWSEDPLDIESATGAMTQLYIKNRAQQEVW
ncbi:pyruvate ferredoxin oxidoreductase [Nitzschia inconspicua]|uniref:pyruvate dehydrogenase (NADP(+)) n=1 Tax=Nitzschia inconspicua TaxID=303405 RepID=A0A9K3L9W1_9STRA|nr:pyruvate ferredoxin oxidoreductase [Nitzschia inconspicua]